MLLLVTLNFYQSISINSIEFSVRVIYKYLLGPQLVYSCNFWSLVCACSALSSQDAQAEGLLQLSVLCWHSVLTHHATFTSWWWFCVCSLVDLVLCMVNVSFEAPCDWMCISWMDCRCLDCFLSTLFTGVSDHCRARFVCFVLFCFFLLSLNFLSHPFVWPDYPCK